MNLREIGRYLKIKGEIDEKTRALIEEVYPIAARAPFLKRTAEFNIEYSKSGILLKGTDIILEGRLAERHFARCGSVIAVLASLGMESERMLRETYALSPSRGVVLDACYSEFLERKLDETEAALAQDGRRLTSRISCGYGDLPLGAQAPLLRALDSERAGVFMNESFMLTPNKSVLALVGVAEEE